MGTNDRISEVIHSRLRADVNISIASNPEFLREGSAIHDTFHGDRIVIGAEDRQTRETLDRVFAPLAIPVYHTDIRSAEMIKYASNAFLAAKSVLLMKFLIYVKKSVRMWNQSHTEWDWINGSAINS